MTGLAIIGNISRDTVSYPGRPTRQVLGGAALHTALAAARAGIRAAPVSMIGPDLAALLQDLRVVELDMSSVAQVPQPSCAFELDYDERGTLLKVHATYGAAHRLTRYALSVLPRYRRVHVCCRQPLEPAPILAALRAAGTPFSVDFVISSVREVVSTVGDLLPSAEIAFVTAVEYAAITAVVPAQQLPAVAVTDGPRRAVLYRFGKPVAQANPPSVETVDVTGAGDTFAGTFLAGIVSNEPDQRNLDRAVMAAAAKVASEGIQIPAAVGED